MDSRSGMRSQAAIVVLALALFLAAACTPAAPPQGYAESSPTPPPTEPPTKIPTATTEPTETPDPNMPDGATGKDAKGNYIKEKDGVSYTWEKVQYGSSPESFVEGWFRNGNADGLIPLVDQGAWWDANQNSVNMEALFMENQQKAQKIVLLNHPQYGTLTNELRVKTFTPFFMKSIAEHYFRRKINHITNPEWQDFTNALEGESNSTVPIPVTISFVNPDGTTHNWKISPSTKYKFYYISWADADPTIHHEFSETHSRYDTDTAYRWSVTADADGNLIGLASTQTDVNSLTPDQIIRMVLAPVAEAAIHENIPTQGPGEIFDDDVEWFIETAQGKFHAPAHFTIVNK